MNRGIVQAFWTGVKETPAGFFAPLLSVARWIARRASR